MNTKLLSKIENPQMKKIPDIRPGDTVRVHQKIREGSKERVQIFEGVVLKVKGGGLRQSFLVRKLSFGVGVEKNFLFHSPNVAKIEVKRRAKVRQAYLGYLRKLTGKSARLKDKQFDSLTVNIKDESQEAEAATAAEKIDEEITEISEEKVAAIEAEEVPLSEVEKEEEKKANDTRGDESPDDGGQAAEIEEITEGADAADKDTEKGKSTEGKNSEKSQEEV